MKNIKLIKDKFYKKICTILTKQTAKTNFNEKQFIDFFCGLVIDVNDDGVFIEHPQTYCVSFFVWESIVGLIEEQVIDESHPEYKNIIQNIQQQAHVETKSENESPFINMDQLQAMIQK